MWKDKFRIRLFVFWILMIGVSILVAAIFMMSMLKQSLQSEIEQNMIREMKIINTMIEWQTDPSIEMLYPHFSSLAMQLREQADARVTFIHSSGQVLGDSDFPAKQMNNHLNREEIQLADEQGIGIVVRSSPTLSRKMMYVAMPVLSENQQEKLGYIRLSMNLDHIEATMRNIWIVVGAGLLLLCLIAGVGSFRMARHLTRPLEQLSVAASEIAKGNYSPHIEVRHRDEMGQLAVAIRHMTNSLQRQMSQIKSDEAQLANVLEHMGSGIFMVDEYNRIGLMNKAAGQLFGLHPHETRNALYERLGLPADLAREISLCQTNKSRKKLELTLYFPQTQIVEVQLIPTWHDQVWKGTVVALQNITEIRRLETMRSEFVANVSHELKTPVSAVKGYAETLLTGAMKEPKIAEDFLTIIYEESERIDRLIDDLLELSKIESRKTVLQYSPVEVEPFLIKTTNMLQSKAKEKQIALNVHVEKGIFIEADEDRLRQIILNLVANGINYTSVGGSVTISAAVVTSSELNAEKVSISVTDTGIGIPKQDIPRLFERFYRVDKARSRSSGGTGLGLSIVKHLVELHGGEIKVESEMNMGSTFTIQLPIIQ